MANECHDGLTERIEDRDRSEGLDTAPRLPGKIGRYRVARLLGQGGYGVVYEAYDDEAARAVAIKVPHPDRDSPPGRVEAYLGEARILASLDHPHIVPVYDVVRDGDGVGCVVSKFIEGGDLAKRIARGNLSIPESAALVARVADALHHAHIRRLVHRDIKPANILIDASGSPHIADFGLALGADEFGKGPKRAGTPDYMSPEQARREGHRVDGRSDIFSLGSVFYELLTGQRPFRASSQPELLDLIATTDVRPPRQINDTIPRELERICLKAMARKASDRYTTARDMAEDLRHFLENGANPNTQPVSNYAYFPGAPPPPEATPALTLKASDSGGHAIKVVPKGLRAFDHHDADFFLELLPGPRDRQGLPDSLRFWLTRIEAIDPDRTFRVGLIYGPSGCGKSSLLKAGLLPRIAGYVVPVYIEATAEETETRLGNALRRTCPDLSPQAGLGELLQAIRTGRVLRPGRKILLVLDQFEQWLHAKRGEGNTELVAALRQCDGEHTQAIILVRDDFWMAATRLMNELEVDLVSDRNLAAVDLFDPGHARKVLLDFGRAYGAMPETGKLPKDREAFLDQVVVGLTQGGKVVPVCLALFADLIKGKPWTAATLAEVGGAEGVGKRFLKETFESEANPRCNRHQKAAQAVLKALLPESLADIRGPTRSEEELVKAAGYAHCPREFDQLRYILAWELRLVTPVDHEGSSSQLESAAPAGGHFYQLTHDYLIHSVREWLDDKKRETWRGRAELLLTDRAALWGLRHESRTLPSWPEYLYLLFGTRRRNRSAPEVALMRAAGRRVGVRFALLAAFLLGIVAWSWNEIRQRDARELYHRLVDAPTTGVQPIIDEMSALRPWIDPILRRETGRTFQAGDRTLLNLSLALLPTDPSQATALRKHLLVAGPSDLRVIRSALKHQQPRLSGRHWNDLIAQLWAGVEERSFSTEEMLRATCGLAELDPLDHERWERVAKTVVACLLTKHSMAASDWIELLVPVGKAFGPELKARFYDKRWSDDQRLVAATALARFLHDDVDTMVELAVSSSPTQLAEIVPALQRRSEEAAVRLEATFQAEKAPADTAERVLDGLAMRRAAAAVALFGIGRGARTFAALSGGPNPRVRTYLIHEFEQVRVAPELLLQELKSQREPSIQQALILALGQYDPMTLGSAVQRGLIGHLVELYRSTPSVGVHSASFWLLKRMGESEGLQAPTSRDPVADRDWYVNGLGQTFAVIRGPKPLPFVDHATNIPRATIVRVGRSFAVATTEVTRRRLAEVLGPEGWAILKATGQSNNEDLDRPVASISYYHAAKYCRRLSERELIDPEQTCYPPVEEIGPGMELPPDHLNRTGYRLPTEAEWVYACLADAQTIYPFGSDAEMSRHYAWYFKNSANQNWPVGLLKPNDFGLFDILGNVYEWCEPFPDGTPIAADVAGGPPGSVLIWASRGGAFRTRAHVESIVASYRKFPDPTPAAPPSWQGDKETGFRVVRTCR